MNAHQFEEVVVHTDAFEPETSRHISASASSVVVLARRMFHPGPTASNPARQRLVVHFAMRCQRQRIQDHEGGGHHVVGSFCRACRRNSSTGNVAGE